jgi:hypothetical protein
MPSAVEGTLTLTEGDLAAGYRDLRGPKAVSWVPPLVVLAIPVFLLVTPGLMSWVALAPALLFVVVWYRLLPKTLAKKHFARMKPEDLRLEFEFSEQGYRIRTTGSDFRQVYSSVHSYLDGVDTLALFTPGQIAQLVPKRAFSAEGIRQIGEWLKASVPPRPTQSLLPNPRRALLLWASLIVAFVSIWYFLAPAR